MLLRIGSLAALTEGAAALARRGGPGSRGRAPAQGSKRFGADALAAISRVNGRDVALRIATEGLRWVAGAAADGETQSGALADRLRLAEIHSAQAGLIADMDLVADAVYGRERVPASGGGTA